MATASIAVSVKARTASFNKKLKQSGRNVESFGSKIRRLAKGIAKFGTAITAVAAGALAYFIKQSFTALDSLAKASARLGVTVDSLRSLERAAELSGSSIKTLRKALLNISKNVTEAAAGTGEAVEAFKELGLDATKLIGLKPDEVFFRIAKAVERLPAGTRKIGLLSDVLTIRGAELINMLDLGEHRLRAMVKESVRLSGSFTAMDLSAIERANDAIADMRRALRSIMDQLAVLMAPTLEGLAKRLTDWFVRFRKAMFDTLPDIGNFLKETLNLVDRAGRAIAKTAVQTARDIAIAFAELPFGLGLSFRPVAKRLHAASKAPGITTPKRGGRMLLGDVMAQGIEKAVQIGQRAFARGAVDTALRRERAEFKTFENLFRNPMEFFREPLRRFGRALEQGMKTGAKHVAEAVAAPRTRMAEFMQVSPTRYPIPGLAAVGREQIVKDRETHRRLDELIRVTGDTVAVFS